MTDHTNPEHNKLRAIADKSQTVGEFLEWLGEQGLTVCRFQELTRHSDELGDYSPEGYYPARTSREKLLAEFFDIDLDKIEAEKRAMLDALQPTTGATT